jgi:outer membrane murein-binding lipoprotein Lpp
MNLDRSLLVTAVCVLVALMAGCNSVRKQFRQAVQEMKADVAILDSTDDGLDAFGSADAKHLRAARAGMWR